MGLLSHRVERSEIVAGDHIYTWRAVFAYSHHGIYVGGSKVVHFTREPNPGASGVSFLSSSDPTSDPFSTISCSSSAVSSTCSDFPDCGFRKPGSGVVLSCLDCFLGRGSLYRFEYGVTPSAFLTKLRGGTCTTAESDPQKAVIYRAMFLLHNGFGNYDVFKNNCEDFSIYCKTGLSILDKTALGRSGQAVCGISFPLAAVLSSPFKLFMSGPVGMAAAMAGMYCMSRYASDMGVRTDTIKIPVEDMALFFGWEGPNEEFPEENDGPERQNRFRQEEFPEMGFLSQKIERSQVVAGDHIYAWRTAFTFSHHGIYIGERRVVHFVDTDTFGSSSSIGSILKRSSSLTSTSISDPSVCPEFLDCGFQQPESGVVLSCLDCFLAGDSLYRFEYGVPTHHLLFKLRGCTCTTAKSDPPELVNHRALYLLRHGFLDYDTLSNNCEHFAMYCKTGLLCIGGGLIGQASALKTPIYATGTCAVLKWLTPGALIVKATAAVLTHLTSRYIDDLGVRSDDSGSERPLVVKVPVEDLSTFCASGTSGRSSFRAGKKTSYDKPAATSFSAMGKTMIRHPDVKWAQRLDKVYITVLLSDAKHVEVNLEPDGRFTFSAIAGVENHLYGVKLSLYGKVNLKGGQINQRKRSILCVIMKTEKKWWKKLLRGDEKMPHNVKVDWEKWVDEEDDDFDKSDEHEELAKSEEEDSA
ncbi:hypothetical protein RHMOL_Rhmol07G0093300 [Rhododendron molle]|uniref:Uncharacterized protein n=1 Tax=Rhododendron molle TaxID=49168 RepID=A0ACC0MYZ4_RHOML|nr:hypothetical protein RHMOL_Rhmol07G0093300 [Rhododendron molle]